MINYLEALKKLEQKVSIHINEYYSAIGIIRRTTKNWIELEETNTNTPNKNVFIPINKIVYIRPIKQ